MTYRYSTALCGGLAALACFGGQSGGETGLQSADPDAPAACACVPEGSRPVRAKVTRLESGCAELEVLELLTPPVPDEYRPLRVGDVFGGTPRLMCAGSNDVVEGAEVLALFNRGTQTTTGCVEYRDCSRERCGAPEAAYTTATDPACEAARADDPTVDCEPIEMVDQAVLEAYDQCDTRCLEETRDICMAHENDEQLGGTVSVATWEDDAVHFYWAGEHRRELYSNLEAVDCSSNLNALWSRYFDARPSRPASPQTVAAPPPTEVPATPSIVCPLPPQD